MEKVALVLLLFYDLQWSLAAPSHHHQPSASFCAMGVATASQHPQNLKATKNLRHS